MTQRLLADQRKQILEKRNKLFLVDIPIAIHIVSAVQRVHLGHTVSLDDQALRVWPLALEGGNDTVTYLFIISESCSGVSASADVQPSLLRKAAPSLFIF